MSIELEERVIDPPASSKSTDAVKGVIWREAIFPYLLTRLSLFLVGILAVFWVLPLLKPDKLLPTVAVNAHFPDGLWRMWEHFDGGFYIAIAQNGYDTSPGALQRASNWIYHPLYSVLISPFGHLFGGSGTAFIIAAVLVANLMGLVAVVLLYLLVRRDFSPAIAARTVIFLGIFPTSFYLSATFSESTFLACAIACLYFSRRRLWWLAGISGGLAFLARVQGVALLLPVVWEYWQVLADRYAPLPAMSELTLSQRVSVWLRSRFGGLLPAARELTNWVNLLAISLIPLGLIPFMIYSYFATGDPLASIHDHSAPGWNRGITNPIHTLVQSLLHPFGTNAFEWNFWALNVIFIFAFLGFTIWAFRRLPWIYAFFTLAMVVLPLATGSINSISRYYMPIFPAMILLAIWTMSGAKEKRNFAITLFFVTLQAVLMLFFALGLPLIA